MFSGIIHPPAFIRGWSLGGTFGHLKLWCYSLGAFILKEHSTGSVWTITSAKLVSGSEIDALEQSVQTFR